MICYISLVALGIPMLVFAWLFDRSREKQRQEIGKARRLLYKWRHRSTNLPATDVLLIETEQYLADTEER